MGCEPRVSGKTRLKELLVDPRELKPRTVVLVPGEGNRFYRRLKIIEKKKTEQPRRV